MTSERGVEAPDSGLCPLEQLAAKLGQVSWKRGCPVRHPQPTGLLFPAPTWTPKRLYIARAPLAGKILLSATPW